MTYLQIKRMIIIIPTLTVGIWEYVRHQFLLPYISMEVGNWLTPIFVYAVSVTLLRKLFHMLERIQEELERERAAKAAFEAREHLARELHDGIAQSLFLLSVKVDRLEQSDKPESLVQELYGIRKKIHEVNRYVRQAISNLRYDPSEKEKQLSNESLDVKIQEIANNVHVEMTVNWNVDDQRISVKEKVELLACIREAVLNIDKHAEATNGWIHGQGDDASWRVTIEDNGKGFEEDPFKYDDHYGLNIMRERAEMMDWGFGLFRNQSHTVVELTKEGTTNDRYAGAGRR